MKNRQNYFASYAQYHQSSGNQLTHYFGIPMILFSTLGLLALVPLTSSVQLGTPSLTSLALLLWIAGSVFFIRLDAWFGGAFALLTLAALALSLLVPIWIHITLFVLGWILQGIGHSYFEKKSPAFLTNLTHLLIGPYWIFCKLIGRS